MGYTKRQFVTAAFEEIGLAAYVFDLTPEQLNSAMVRMDAMMATWNGKGIRVGYPIPSSPQNSTLDQETNVPDSANEAIITNTAVRIASGYGKTVSPDTKSIARQSYEVLLSRAAMPQEMQFPDTLPRGAGNRTIDIDPYMPPPSSGLLAGQDGPIEFN